MNAQQKITPFLWFDSQAEEAANFYISVFQDGKIHDISRNDEGKVFGITFEVKGQQLMGLNAGPHFQFNEAVSLYVHCEDQAEVDDLWAKLLADGGEESHCGWLKDRFGLSWQIVPKRLGELLAKDDSGRVMAAMLKMIKLDVAGLEAAYAGD